eukprot:GFUD01041171.1.p1 GENE.GFUD01041171.1~~GFUD01041171.1.p1  ORF type:complete len:128 (-),score=26.46 GFUD01041171.1:174-557(-)
MCPLSPCFHPVSLSAYTTQTISEFAPHVMAVAMSNFSEEGRLYLNLTTKEGHQFTVEQSSQGFQVVGYSLNAKDVVGQPIYETPAALLNTVSLEYTRAFASHLIYKLEALAEDQFILSLTSCRLVSD